MNAAQDEKMHGTSASDDTASTFVDADASVAYRLARHEADEELNAVAVLGYN